MENSRIEKRFQLNRKCGMKLKGKVWDLRGQRLEKSKYGVVNKVQRMSICVQIKFYLNQRKDNV